ncbi:hypothetical protein JOF53_004752 [Crossiella equi]|uniref:Uncharacterized protein n=1 Tax=Crossiella equi TaxID=130796 RepID=A0ABS5AH26_9PSEU|nr:hypothetical protein [Crossiella equi]MBP2475880.1 hypothetical protein [Crossiella equi]
MRGDVGARSAIATAHPDVRLVLDQFEHHNDDPCPVPSTGLTVDIGLDAEDGFGCLLAIGVLLVKLVTFSWLFRPRQPVRQRGDRNSAAASLRKKTARWSGRGCLLAIGPDWVRLFTADQDGPRVRWTGLSVGHTVRGGLLRLTFPDRSWAELPITPSQEGELRRNDELGA